MHAPVSTFERNGKQYVIAYSAGSALLGSARGDSVWLFALDGTLPPVQSGSPVSRLAAAAAPNPPLAAVATLLAEANLERGKQLYTQACVVCHGEDGKGGHGVGAPLASVTDLGCDDSNRVVGPQQHAAVQRDVHAGAGSRRERVCGECARRRSLSQYRVHATGQARTPSTSMADTHEGSRVIVQLRSGDS